LQQQIRAAEDEKKRYQTIVDSAQKREEALRDSLASAKDEATRAKLEAELKKATDEKTQAQRAVRSVPKPGGGGAAKPCNCPPGDPLCSCL
jgi:colicin import membrane protein